MLKNKIINANKCAPPHNKTEKTHSVSVYDYDALGRRTLTQNVTGQTLRTVYDGRGFEVIREGETFRDGSLTTSYSSSAQTRGQNNTLRSNEPTGERYRWISEGGTATGEGYAIQGSRYGGRGVTLYGNGEAVAVSYSSSSGGKSVYLGKDLLGSVRSATANGGSLEDRYEYDAFGQPYAGDLEGMMNLGYTGKPYDATTGLYNYGYRDYRPQVARFTTVDPIRDGSNWFAYVNNDPVNWIDPWGLEVSDSKKENNNNI
jgi:RHS repeat-associated protein